MNELAKVENELIFEPAHITKDTIKKYLCPNASDQELIFGLQVAKTFNLNPLKREIYFVKYGNNPMQILTGYEVYLKRAARSGLYRGMKSWTEGSVEKGDLKGCVEVYVKGWEEPLIHEADYSEYVQRKIDGTINRFWREKPKTMIKKVAISQAFRLAYPDEFDGMPYTRDEVIDVEKQENEKLPEPVEMPKLKAETKKEAIPEARKPQEAVISRKTPVAMPVANEAVKAKLSNESLDKLLKASKFLGMKLNYVLKSLEISDIEDVKDDATAEKVYKAAYKLYKSEIEKDIKK